MMLQFTPFEPVIWLIFAAFLLGTVIIVKLFHRRYPNYPKDAADAAKSKYSKLIVAEKKSEMPVE
jgi:hypothetical protein